MKKRHHKKNCVEVKVEEDDDNDYTQDQINIGDSSIANTFPEDYAESSIVTFMESRGAILNASEKNILSLHR